MRQRFSHTDSIKQPSICERQSLQCPHGLHPPSTAAGKEAVSMNWKHFDLSYGIIIILQVQFEIRVDDSND